MRTIATLILMMALACIAHSAPPKKGALDVTGDVVSVVRSFPITIRATPGADDYTWLYPPGVTATEADNVLTITDAPGGELKVSCKAVTWVIDFDKKTKTVTKELSTTTLVIGGLFSPKPERNPPPALTNDDVKAAIKQALNDAAKDRKLNATLRGVERRFGVAAPPVLAPPVMHAPSVCGAGGLTVRFNRPRVGQRGE